MNPNPYLRGCLFQCSWGKVFGLWEKLEDTLGQGPSTNRPHTMHNFKRWKREFKESFTQRSYPHLPINGQRGKSFSFKLTTTKGEEPLDQTTRPWRWCLHAATPSWYSSSGIMMASLSPLILTRGNWLKGMSKTLLEITLANDLGFGDFFLLGRIWLNDIGEVSFQEKKKKHSWRQRGKKDSATKAESENRGGTV